MVCGFFELTGTLFLEIPDAAEAFVGFFKAIFQRFKHRGQSFLHQFCNGVPTDKLETDTAKSHHMKPQLCLLWAQVQTPLDCLFIFCFGFLVEIKVDY